jgi:hypothetical protein
MGDMARREQTPISVSAPAAPTQAKKHIRQTAILVDGEKLLFGGAPKNCHSRCLGLIEFEVMRYAET